MTPPTEQPRSQSGLVPPHEEVIEHRRVRQRRGSSRARVNLNLTAMIDVTFLLLVYFLVATEFKLGEEVYRLDLPQNLQSDRERDPFELDEQPIRISVTTTGINDYRVAIEGPFGQPATFEELNRKLLEFQINEDNSAGWYMPEHPIIIEPARSAAWDHAVGAFNAAHRARYTNIKFAKPK